VPYPDGRFDLAVSEYGAAIWCDPYVLIPGFGTSEWARRWPSEDVWNLVKRG
jgi:hypothetical protein